MSKVAGLNAHRLKSNPEEAKFAMWWDRWNRHGSTLAHALYVGDGDGSHPPEPSERDKIVAATVIQWLGSPTGKAFLNDVGYEK
jgi:hypothetical protein